MRYLLLALLMVVSPSWGDETRSVVAHGKAELLAAPDRAIMRFGVESRQPTVDQARAIVAETVDRFLRITRGMDITDDHVATAAAIVRPDYDWNPQTRERRLLGYMVTRQITVDLRDIGKIGALTEAALGAGINHVDEPYLDTTQRDALERKALARAAGDARSRAEVLASALDARIGAVRNIQTSSVQAAPMAAMSMAREGGGAETYQPGQIRVAARVTATFDLIPVQ